MRQEKEKEEKEETETTTSLSCSLAFFNPHRTAPDRTVPLLFFDNLTILKTSTSLPHRAPYRPL